MGSVALDASVVIALLEPTDVLHGRARIVLTPWLQRGHRRSMSAIAYAESLVHPIARGVEGIVESFVDEAQIRIVEADRRLSRQAASLRASVGIALGDAYVLASARALDAELLTFDERLLAVARELA